MNGFSTSCIPWTNILISRGSRLISAVTKHNALPSCKLRKWTRGEGGEDWLSGADPQYPNLCLTLRSRFAWLSAAFTPVQVQVQIPTKAPGQTFAKIQLDFRFSNEILYLYINVIWCLKIYLQCCENDNTWFLVDAWYKSLTKFMWPIWMIDAQLRMRMVYRRSKCLHFFRSAKNIWNKKRYFWQTHKVWYASLLFFAPSRPSDNRGWCEVCWKDLPAPSRRVISVKYRAEILSAGRNLLSRIYTSFSCHLQPVHPHLLCLEPDSRQETENMNKNERHFCCENSVRCDPGEGCGEQRCGEEQVSSDHQVIKLGVAYHPMIRRPPPLRRQSATAGIFGFVIQFPWLPKPI